MIELQKIRKVYQMGDTALEVLKGVDITIHDGDFVAIMGPSGSGKSTLMNILGLLDVPSTGSYQFNGREVSGMTEDELAVLRREEIGFIFQQFNLLSRMSATQNVALPLLYSKKEKGVEGALSLLKGVGLDTRSDHRPNELSGGQQQRVAIARSLVNRPAMVLADEPTGNLDSISEKEILKILKDLNQSGITVVIVTHEEEIGAQAHRLIRMRDGVVQSDERRQAYVPAKEKRIPASLESQASFFDFIDYFHQGFQTLASNKLRTGLSMLGILIGVAAVVAMLALGRGAQAAIQQQLSSLGSNLLLVHAGMAKVGGVTQDSNVSNRLDYEDGATLKNRISTITYYSAQVNGRAQVTAEAKNWVTQVQAVSPAWQYLHTSVPDKGRFFTEEENTQRARVAVLGETVRSNLFDKKSGIGEMIKINKVIFQVIGILPKKGATGWRDQDDTIVIPVLTGMHRLIGRANIDILEVQIDKPENLDAGQDSVTRVLNDIHRIPMSQADDAFEVRNMADIQQAVQQSNNTMSILLASIAAISLVVGGIGIMNIMLVSVTERTKEIGLRKAIGARRNDILLQFLSESVVVSAIGGLIGILLGWGISKGIALATGWGTVVSIQSVVLSFCVSALIGIVFGVYPARKAARMNPIEALRFE